MPDRYRLSAGPQVSRSRDGDAARVVIGASRHRRMDVARRSVVLDWLWLPPSIQRSPETDVRPSTERGDQRQQTQEGTVA
jgi:hypothetical protein